MPITQTEALQIDLSTAKAGSQAGTGMLRKVAITSYANARSMGDSTGAVGCRRESAPPKRGECRGNSSQAP